MFGLFVNKKKLRLMIAGIERTQAMLDRQFEGKLISSENYYKQSDILRANKLKYEKKLGIKEYDKY